MLQRCCAQEKAHTTWRHVVFKQCKTYVSSKNDALAIMQTERYKFYFEENREMSIQLTGTNVRLPKMHNIPPEVAFGIPNISCKIGVLERSRSALLGSVSHMTIFFVVTCMMNAKIKQDYCLSQALGHCVIDRANLFNDHRISGLPIRAKYEYFRKSESILLTILHRISFLLL